MTNRFLNPRTQYLTEDGKPLPNGEANFYENGTLVRKDTFKDVNEDSINANPVLLNGDGSIPNVFYPGTARMILTFNDGSGREQRFDIPNVGIAGDGSAFDIWVNIVEYGDGSIVEGSDGEYYRSLQNNNTGNDPISSPTFWEQVSFLRTWNPNITYGLGDGGVVGSDGKQYRSLQASNLNNDPISSPSFWGVNNPFDQSLNEADSVVFAEVDAILGANTPAAVNGTSGDFSGTVRKNGTHPTFQSYVSSTITNITGDGTVYTIIFGSETFDQGSNFNTTTGVFTAPVTGKYLVTVRVDVRGATASMTDCSMVVVTSNRSYRIFSAPQIQNPNEIIGGSSIVDMDANDVASVTLQCSGESSDIIDVAGGATLRLTTFSMTLLA